MSTDGLDQTYVVSQEWLSSNLDSVIPVDVRDAWEYEGIGHIPQAVSIPFDTFRTEGGDIGQLPGAEAFAEVCQKAGIERDDTLVAYDDTHGVFAARFVVTAIRYGHPDVRLLNGDFSGYQRQYPTESGTLKREPSAYPTPEPIQGDFVDAETVVAAIEAGEAVFVDTREDWEYEEGHLPGAIQFDWRTLVDDETRGLLPVETLKERLEEAGITPEKQIILYCNTARRISHTYVVLKALGYDSVGFFEESLEGWENVEARLKTGV